MINVNIDQVDNGFVVRSYARLGDSSLSASGPAPIKESSQIAADLPAALAIVQSMFAPAAPVEAPAETQQPVAAA